mgnify:FL=1|tara:strand:+ start:480 stop:926 length:447 start_codon:yes stop_codon:yes gene_type:complete
MLAELAIANAAFAVIKETVANGGDIMAAGKHLFSFFDNKAAIAKKANASGSDSEAFFALEQIKQNEEELKEIMIYCGRPGLWDDWLKFQVDAKRRREEDAKEVIRAQLKRKQQIWAWINGALIAISVLSGVIFIAILVWATATRSGNG